MSCDSEGYITDLKLSNFSLVGTIPKSFGQLTSLYFIDMSNNSLTGTIPVELKNAPYLLSIDFSRNKLSGKVPAFLGNETFIGIIYLSHNQFSGPIPESLGKSVGLQVLDLSYNKLVGSIPSFKDSSSIQILDLSHNNLQGKIPKDIGLFYFYTLNLEYNSLTGRVPNEILELPSLNVLKLRNNRLSGFSPKMEMFALITLDLSNNLFTGTIDKLLNGSAASEINLANNFLVGSIPSYLSKARKLDLSGNSLSGKIPSSFTEFSYLNLYGNSFSGLIPIPLNSKSKNPSLKLGKNCLSYPQGWNRLVETQRSRLECKQLCYARSKAGSCYGHGACLFKNTQPKCICNPGYSPSITKLACLKN